MVTVASKSNKAKKSQTKPLKVKKDPLLKFLVNFRRPRNFRFKNGRLLDYGGHFGFDWLREKYISPVVEVAADNSGTAIGTHKPLCTNISKLKGEYLKGVSNKIKPHNLGDYYPAWLSIFPYCNTEEAKRRIPTASVMHRYGAKLSLEIEEIDALKENTNTIEFEVDSNVSNFLSISPQKIDLKDFIKKGEKQVRVVDALTNIEKTFWVLKDAVKIKCQNDVLTSHAEIKAIAKGTDKEEQVGQLMVYANDKIPKAEIVLVALIFENENVSILEDESIEFWFKNRSFNQALIRVEVKIQNNFKLEDLPQNQDVRDFISNYKGNTVNDDDKFKKDLYSLYETYGRFKPTGGTIESTQNERTYIFLTNLSAGTLNGSASLIETKDASGNLISWNWGNGAVIFANGLNQGRVILHELGHSLNLCHIFEPTTISKAPTFYQGYTDNVMDYTWSFVTPTSTKENVFKDKLWYFFKWQWDLIRKDGSLKW